MQKIIYFLDVGSYFLSHRLPTAFAAMDVGYEVHLVAIDDGVSAQIKSNKIIFHARSMQTNATPIIASFLGLIQLLAICARIKPSVLHVIGLKSSPIGLLSALFLWRTRVLLSINGLGFLFSDANLGIFYKMIRGFVMAAFAIVTSIRNVELIFQNDDDIAVFNKNGTLKKATIHIVRGSGVDMDYFQPEPLPLQKPKIVFGVACRMVKIKGVLELIEAVRQLQDGGEPIKLLLAGEVDKGNPGSLSKAQLKELCSLNAIEWRGFVHDMKGFWSECHVAVLPSYGGEGLPLALLSAAAMGRPLIASDSNGNRDLVIEGQNGYLCKPRDIDSLKTTIREILEADLVEYGKASHRIVQDRGMSSSSVRKTFQSIYAPANP